MNWSHLPVSAGERRRKRAGFDNVRPSRADQTGSDERGLWQLGLSILVLPEAGLGRYGNMTPGCTMIRSRFETFDISARGENFRTVLPRAQPGPNESNKKINSGRRPGVNVAEREVGCKGAFSKGSTSAGQGYDGRNIGH